ncbi:Glycosyltransferase involved in cell wall bisynthesis [Micrococcus luteus]|uniref:Glycosyltransferase involved in cell wall bisynthesis n=2 Tax=Micrococcus TaxID=1269 RepID=A0ABD7M4W6_MICLU|nr:MULTISPECIES: glycosyltransferase [Micrococcus]MCT1761204.1 glycosyltransferase [Micrococcus luteus]MCV7481666.1 glycosyltransferase [Micrococcus luteus]MCV7501706.1 glycosyltransferase [Micrococcus luteus]MCV7548690.1 glycosyltransferase [Micrococcus luteus]MCV7557527.1 glycosyltransferase [Micrococcus luteus]
MHDTPTSNIADVRILLYGDVNLNVMDGSAIWLPSLAETLSLTGAQVHVQLKAVETRDLLSGPLRRLSGVTVHDAPVAEAEDAMERGQAAEALEALDAALDFDVLLVRGSEMCLEIVERGTFEGRLWSYVTEYGYIGGGFPDDLIRRLNRVAAGSRLMLAQTEHARAVLEALVPAAAGRTELLSPMIPDSVRPHGSDSRERRSLRLVYTGKFAHDWRTDRMPEILTELRDRGVESSLTMVGDKVHREPRHPGWASSMRAVLESDEPGFSWVGALSREESMEVMGDADVSLGWRASDLDLSLEISTKVLESCALGVPPLVNRTTIHEDLLGADYPLFVDALDDTPADIADRLVAAAPRLDALSEHVFRAAAPYRMSARADALRAVIERVGALERPRALAAPRDQRRRIVLAGHDLKFAGELVDMLRADPDVELRIDHWTSLHAHDEDASEAHLEWADVVICEWAGPNAVWYSHRKRPGQRLVVRLHMFELRGAWLPDIDTATVDTLVVVSELNRGHVLDAMDIRPDAVRVVPNAVSIADLERPGRANRQFRLGLVGIVPMLKRPDRAIDLLRRLRAEDGRFTLHIRGRMPWEYPHIWRKMYEREGYAGLLARLGASDLRDAVAFEPFGADMGTWYTKVGWMLSPSATESFHLAPVEGMASGAVPIVWDRPGARGVFGEEFVLDDTDAAARRVLEATAVDARWDALSALARDRVRSYDERVVAGLWREALGLD